MEKFFLELVKRFMADTPWFFKIIRIVGIITALITGLPGLLLSAGIELPESLMLLSSKSVAISSLVASFISQLTATSSDKKDFELKD